MGGISGMDRLTARLGAIEQDMLEAAQARMAAVLERVKREAQESCPVQSGRLRSSITAQVTRTPEGITCKLCAQAPYAAAVELGLTRQAARPFLYPAYAANRHAMLEAAGRAAGDAMEGR